MVIPSIAADARLRSLVERLKQPEGVVHVSGLWGSSAPMVAATTAAANPRTCLYVTAHLEGADEALDDIELFLGRPCELFPAWEALPGEGGAAGEIEAERLRLCGRLMSDRLPTGRKPAPQASACHCSRAVPPTAGTVIVAPIQALMQPVPTPATLERNTLRLVVGSGDVAPGFDRLETGSTVLSPQKLIAWAIDRGFERLDMVESPGDCAARGDIVDLFVPGETNPYRIQFLGDAIESIRRFDVSTQRSIENRSSIAVTAVPKGRSVQDELSADLIGYLPADTLVILDSPSEIEEMARTLQARLGDSARLFGASEVLAACNRLPQMHFSRFGAVATAGEDTFDFRVMSLARFEGTATDAVTELCHLAQDHVVHVVCDNEGERGRLEAMIAEQTEEEPGKMPVPPRRMPVAPNIQTHIGVMHRGFSWTAAKTIVVAHHELFRRHRQRRRIRRVHAAAPLESWSDLKPGDVVVHLLHGIAVFRGLSRMRKGTSRQREEFLTLEFADDGILHAPCSQIDLVQKYIGAGGRRPQLSKLGGKRWKKTTQQVAEAVAELAESLLRIQAIRAQTEGNAYPADTEWQREFESAFPYEETEDQLLVAKEICEDLTRPRPMDRLVCGDVGYGKTELAMRAAFKVVEFGRQVALLVPTTVLAEQHYETFTERLAEYPFVIGCLSRFRSPKEQRKIIEGARKGQIDVVIGTHRLLSKDVAFANLGLVIIDEEQRFGVEHKERLKQMRATVDVLTMTATPIPRTLHMSMVGIRDISSLQTPPIDRRAIATRVCPFDGGLIRDAIVRELNRDGQVYFVHNYVYSIAAMADTVRQLVPEARVVYAHGRMKDDELESVMHAFVRREADVLVATTIIESGIDIPTVNTIFINRAERFGLADLHQLRGRVGRSSHRAYCYLLLSPDHPPTGKASKRLKAIEEFSELGAGFRIAMRDLEIRGAGNLLGHEQSGHIASVGYDMYCRLLDQSVRRLKHEPDPTPPPLPVDLDVAAHIPQHYITADRSRIEIYRRIVACRSSSDLDQLEKDLVDAFGPYPNEVRRMIELAELRVLARQFGIISISLRKPDIVFVIEDLQTVEPVFTDAPGTVRMPDPKTVHLRLGPDYLEPETLLPLLRNMLTRAASGMKIDDCRLKIAD